MFFFKEYRKSGEQKISWTAPQAKFLNFHKLLRIENIVELGYVNFRKKG